MRVTYPLFDCATRRGIKGQALRTPLVVPAAAAQMRPEVRDYSGRGYLLCFGYFRLD